MYNVHVYCLFNGHIILMTICNDIHVQYDMINLPGGNTPSVALEYAFTTEWYTCIFHAYMYACQQPFGRT